MIFPIGPNSFNYQLPSMKGTDEEKLSTAKKKGNTTPPIIKPPIDSKHIKARDVVSERLDNPDLSPVDRSLITKYLAAKDKGPVKRLIRARLILLSSESIKVYTGRESATKTDKQAGALNYLVEALKIFSDDENYNTSLEIYKGYLDPQDQTLIDNYRKQKTGINLDKILNRIYTYNFYQQGSIWGTKARVDMYRRMTAFISLAYAAGISEYDITYASFLDRDALLSKGEQFGTISMYIAASTPERTDDEVWKGLINIYLRRSARDFFSCLDDRHPNMATIKSLATRYLMYQSLGLSLGLPAKEIISIENDEKAKIKIAPNADTGPTKVLTPDALPNDVKHLLQGTEIRKGYTYFQFLKENVKYIVLSSDPYTDPVTKAMMGGQEGGLSLADGVISCNIPDPADLEMPLNIHMFEVIVHETNHAYNRKHYFATDQNKLRSMPDEGSAYLFGARALKKLKENKVPGTDTVRFNDLITSRYVSADAAGKIYGMKDALNLAFGLYDLDTYPTNTPYYTGFESAVTIRNMGLIKEDEVRYFTRIFSDVIQDNVSLEKAPERVRTIIGKMLGKIDAAYKSMSYEKAFLSFEAKLKQIAKSKEIYGLELLQILTYYAADYKINASSGKPVSIVDTKGNSLGSVPKDAKINVIMESDPIMNDKGYVKVTYSGKTGYMLSDMLEFFKP